MPKILFFVFALCLALSIIFTNVLALALNDSAYNTFYTDQQKLNHAQKVINFLKVGKALDANYFSAQAIIHLKDVKSIFDILKIFNSFMLLVVFVVSLYLIKMRDLITLKHGLLLGLIITTLAIVSTFILSILNFELSFIVLHKIFFQNNFWLFPPSDSLVQIFTLDFFVFFTQKLMTNILLTILFILIVIKFIKVHDSTKN